MSRCPCFDPQFSLFANIPQNNTIANMLFNNAVKAMFSRAGFYDDDLMMSAKLNYSWEYY